MNDCIERAEAISICERLRDKTDNEDMAFALNWAMLWRQVNEWQNHIQAYM